MASATLFWDASIQQYVIGVAPTPRRKPTPRPVVAEPVGARNAGGGLTFDRSSGEYLRNGYRMTL